MPSDRIARATKQIDFFLREIRRTSRAGQMSGDLAMILRHLLGKNERLGAAVAFVQSLHPSDLEELAFILGGVPPFGDMQNEHNNEWKSGR